MHHHNPILSVLKSPYTKIYMPLSLWAFEKLAGQNRRDAVLWGNRSRWARFWINLASITVILVAAGLIGFAEFWNHGAELPLWASALAFLGMGLNMLAILVGAGANHRTIDQYYDAQVTWAHYRHKTDLGDTPDKKWMLGFRYGHDLNGVAGSCLSTLVFFLIAYVFFQEYDWSENDFSLNEPGEKIPVFSMQDLSIIFVASRASSILSTICAPLTNQARISYYEKNLEASAEAYQNDSSCQNKASIESILNSIEILKQRTMEARAIRARAFRALESLSVIPSNAKDLLENIINQYKEGEQFAQSKIIQKWNASFLDSLPFIECEFAIALLDKKSRLEEVNKFLRTKILSENPEERLFAQRFRLYALQRPMNEIGMLWEDREDQSKDLSKYIQNKQLNKSFISSLLPDTIHPHADERDFNPEYHIDQVFSALRKPA